MPVQTFCYPDTHEWRTFVIKRKLIISKLYRAWKKKLVYHCFYMIGRFPYEKSWSLLGDTRYAFSSEIFLAIQPNHLWLGSSGREVKDKILSHATFVINAPRNTILIRRSGAFGFPFALLRLTCEIVPRNKRKLKFSLVTIFFFFSQRNSK